MYTGLLNDMPWYFGLPVNYIQSVHKVNCLNYTEGVMADHKDRIRVHIEGKEYSVVGGEFRQMLAVVKQVSGRRFIGELKVWQLPGTAADISHQLEPAGFQLEGGAPVAVDTPAPATSAGRGDRIKIMVQGQQLSVVGGDFQTMLAAVKSLPGRRFDGDTRLWEVPGELAIINQLVETAGFQLEGAGQIPANAPVKPMETFDFGPPEDEPLTFESPDFSGGEDVPPYESPDWLADDNAPPPPTEPPGWWEEPDDLAPPPPPPAEFDNQPPAAPEAKPRPQTSGRQSQRRQDNIRIRIGGIPFVVTGGEFRQMLGAIKQLPGRRFDGDDKVWDIPAEVTIEGAKQKLAALGFDLERD
jgi:hypothetical protein